MPAAMIVDGVALWWRTCKICRCEFLGFPASKVCIRESCQRRNVQRRWRRYYRKHRKRLLVYYKDYHAEHREYRNTNQRARMRKLNLNPKFRAKRRAWREQHRDEINARARLLHKIKKEWSVNAREASAMLASGSFPP